MPDEHGYLNTKEAAAYLGVSDRTVRSLCEDRKITHERLSGRIIRIKKEWLDAYLESIRIPAENKDIKGE